jgi:hypothetical protein
MTVSHHNDRVWGSRFEDLEFDADDGLVVRRLRTPLIGLPRPGYLTSAVSRRLLLGHQPQPGAERGRPYAARAPGRRDTRHRKGCAL